MSRVKMLEIGQPCRKCGTPVVKRAPKKKKASSAYHYHYYLWCPSCHDMYMLETQKYIPKPAPAEPCLFLDMREKEDDREE